MYKSLYKVVYNNGEEEAYLTAENTWQVAKILNDAGVERVTEIIAVSQAERVNDMLAGMRKGYKTYDEFRKAERSAND